MAAVAAAPGEVTAAADGIVTAMAVGAVVLVAADAGTAMVWRRRARDGNRKRSNDGGGFGNRW